jgi:hypothetical protein
MNAPVKIEAGDINARMVCVMRELGAIGKDKKNEAQGFKYRGIDDVYNAINPILAKNGIFMTATVVAKTREERVNSKGTVLAFTCLKMRYQFRAEDGSCVETEAEGEGMDSGDKSSNKAMAVAHKYALLQSFCIPTQDLVDPDAEVHEVKAPAKPAQQAASQQYEDADGQTKAWCDNQKLHFIEARSHAAMEEWLVAQSGLPKDGWEKPKSGSNLDRLKRKFPEAFTDLKFTYENTYGDMK